jgi:NAD(P)-dependent dehydrogenase (short-subunit alcohol dehydrogenase family)
MYSNIFNLDGKTALVVGAGSGLGRAAANALASFGAKVVCADLNLSAAEEVSNEIDNAGGWTEPHQVDLTQVESVRELTKTVGQKYGLHIAITTPSINIRKPLLDYTDEDFDQVINVNLRGTLNLLKEAGGVMVEKGYGSLIAFTSIRSLVVEPGQGVYAATKAGTVQLIRTLAAELGPKGVRANAIAPGVVDTPLTERIRQHPEWYQAYADKSVFGRWAKPEEFAGAVVYLASDAASYVTGSVLFVDGGWTAVDGRFTPPL